MKRKIIIGLTIISGLFLAGGAYIIYGIESSTKNLDTLIKLHQVEILREHFLIQIKNVQSDLVMGGTIYSPGFDTVVKNVINMGMFVDTCNDCHHAPEIVEKLDSLQEITGAYENALSRVLTIRANATRMNEEKDRAFRLGEELTDRVGSMIAFTSSKLSAKTEAALQGIANTKYFLYLLMGIVPLLSLGFALAFIKGLTDPMGSLLGSMRKLEEGDLDHRIVGLTDEFGKLADSINQMAESLREKIGEKEQARQDLAKANQELKIAQEQMVRAETMAAVGTLSSGISHELSTPLSVILNMAQLSRQDAPEDSSLRKDLEIIEYEANQAIKITRSLLGFARSTRSRTDMVNINEILEELFRILEFQPRMKMVRFEKELSGDLAQVRADTGKVRQVFLNVILNAVQAMPSGGAIRVATRNHADGYGEGVEITISDTGVGIPKEQIREIFQPFFTTKEEGTGLGLAITYGIVQEHNGKIEVESQEGEGTTFRIFFPIAGNRRADE